MTALSVLLCISTNRHTCWPSVQYFIKAERNQRSVYCQKYDKRLLGILLMRNKSTNAALKTITFTVEKYASVNEGAIMVFPYIIQMYPSTDDTEAVGKVGDKYKE